MKLPATLKWIGLAAFFWPAFEIFAASPAPRLPPIRHVFLIVLENESYKDTFGKNSPAPYLSQDLVKQGALLPNFYGTAHYSLGNYIAMISGQAPTTETQSDCHSYTDFSGNKLDKDGQAIGAGCVYPAHVMTIADQMDQAHLSWKAYAEDMGNDPARESATCGHPSLNSTDLTEKAEHADKSHLADQYATKHNPFVYFHSIIDNPVCQTHVVNFSNLKQDLQSTATTANFVFITPNLCNDGHDGGETKKKSCVDGRPGGLVTADAFLKQWVPVITASPAFKQDGLLIITFDEAEIDVRYDAAKHVYLEKEGDGSACCGEVAGPNLGPAQTVFGVPDEGPGIIGPGGGKIGAVLLSPFIKAGTVSATPYNHYSMLKTLEDIFGLQHLGYAAQPDLKGFGGDVFDKP
jgi:hypothetical protein